MKKWSVPALGLVLAVLAGLSPAREGPRARPTQPEAPPAGRPAEAPVLEAEGRTQCVPGRKAIIAPVPLHPVEEVLVAPGDRVNKGQVLVKLDDDEPKADVRSKKAQLESAAVTREEAVRALAVAE